MLLYSKSDFSEVNIKEEAKTIASQFHSALKKYWSKVPEHPLYQDKVPIDGGYCDAHIAILRYFLEHKTFKPSETCEFYIQRILVYFELDTPSQFIDKKGLVLNHFSKEDQESLDDGVIFGRELIAALDEMIKILNGANKARESDFCLTTGSEGRKKYYDSLVFVRARKSQDFIIDSKRKLILRYSNEQQKSLKEIFTAIADSCLSTRYPNSLEFSSLTEQQCDTFIEELRNNKGNINASHPLLRQTALSFSIECEAIEAVKSLISKANINWPDETGRCPVHYAAKMGNYPVFELIMSASANLKVIDRDGWSPLYYAVWYLNELDKSDSKNNNKKQDRIKILDLILGKCDLELLLHRDRMGRTAFHYARALELDEDIVSKLYNKLEQLAHGKANEIKEKLVDKAGNLPEELKAMVYVYGDTKHILAASENKQNNENKSNISSAPIDIPKTNLVKENIQVIDEQGPTSNKTTVLPATTLHHQPTSSSNSLQDFNSLKSCPSNMSLFSGIIVPGMDSISLQYREMEKNYKKLMQTNEALTKENERLNRELSAEKKDAKITKEKCSKLQNQFAALQKKFESIKGSDKAQLHEEIERLTKENDDLRKDNEYLRNQVEQLKITVNNNQLQNQMMFAYIVATIKNSGAPISLPEGFDFLNSFSSTQANASSIGKTPVLNPDFLKFMFNTPPAKGSEVTQSQPKLPTENLDELFQPSPP